MLASGGLDSSVLLAELTRKGRPVFPIYIRAGLRWERSEIAVLDFPTSDVVGDHWTVTGQDVLGYRASLASNYIPSRNLSLLAKAAIFCARNRIGEIAMALLHSNPFPDARPEFLRAFEKAVKIGMELPLRVLTPFARLDKAGVIKKRRGLPLQLTLSCARPLGAIHCGARTKCAERIHGFRDARVADPTRYTCK